MYGHFILSSGLRSDAYFQCAKVLQYPEYLTMFGEILSNHFKSYSVDKVISPALGGIVLGTEVGRVGLGENYPEFKAITDDHIWIKNAQKRIREQHRKGIGKFRAYIIPDMRFLNEYDAMKKMENEGYKVITIGIERDTGLPLDNHVSETEIKYCVEKCDYQLDNNLAISSLHNKIHQLLINIEIEFKPNSQKELGFSWEWNA